METWFLKLGLSLSVLLVALPGLLGAGTPTNNSTQPLTAGINYSTATDELGDTENNATSASFSSESLSPSQRNTLLSLSAETHTAAAGSFDTEQTQTFTETSSLSTGPLASTHVVATTEASSSSSSSSSGGRSWRDYFSTEQTSDSSPAVSWEASSWMSTEKATPPQDSSDTTLRQGDASSPVSNTAANTNGTFAFTTISRAGERTLLSVTSSSSNSTSSAFTEDSNSHQPPSTWGVSSVATETEDYTHSAPSTRTDIGETTDQHMTRSFRDMISETGSSVGSRGTQSLNEGTNVTQHQHFSTSEETSDSTPSLRVTEHSTHTPQVSVSPTPPIISSTDGSANIHRTEQGSSSSVKTSTESSTEVHTFSTQNQEGTEVVSLQTSEQSTGWGLTTGPPVVSTSLSEWDTSQTQTATPVVTEVFLIPTPVTITERFSVTEEDTVKASTTAATTTAPTTTTPTTSPPPATSFSALSSVTSSSASGSPTEATGLHTVPSSTASNLAPQSSIAAQPTPRMPSSHTQQPTAGMDTPIKPTTLQTETSTGTLEITTAPKQHITTTFTQTTPSKSTEALQTTRKQIDRGTTELVVTTSPTAVRSTKAPLPAPRNPCASNPCMNGGMCVSNKGHQFTCHCQQGWTGTTCSQDVDECVSGPCPVGSRCVNTQGSFSCECPLGFDLEDGRTCTRAKTFLGTFSVNRLPYDPVVFKSHTMYEIQREIIQLLNASLSVLRGYSRSMLSKKEEDGVRISAVNMFSISTNVTSAEVYNSIQMSLSNCSSSLAHCRMVLHHHLTYHMESLCSAQKTQCDTERSTCSDSSGTARCQCFQGYYKHNPDDLSCLECGDGYKLENGTCVPCMFGFGGFNCGNFYKLIAVVVSPAGGALLLILIIALIVTCCRKDKNDLNKIIFKSGDMQMSPYADFPKSNRISMEWGRETIEMQENGSTKNLLQMTDIYYSPALRNSDLERNGLYPFTGLPGSRHSCIYPAQWNPSFISDDSRRRDYF